MERRIALAIFLVATMLLVGFAAMDVSPPESLVSGDPTTSTTMIFSDQMTSEMEVSPVGAILLEPNAVAPVASDNLVASIVAWTAIVTLVGVAYIFMKRRDHDNRNRSVSTANESHEAGAWMWRRPRSCIHPV